jgi:predicted NBD/HSP70 family sugar kinase
MIIAVDIGGTKTLVMLFDEDGAVKKQVRFPTHPDQYHFTQELTSTIEAEFWSPSVSAISVAVAGSVTSAGVAYRYGNLGWGKIDFPSLFAAYDVPVFAANDANMGALSEVSELAHTPKLAIYVAIGTGIGTGIVTRGSIENEFTQSEGGHMLLQWQGQLQPWEHFASGRAITDAYHQRASDIQDPDTWHEIAERIAAGLQTIIPLLQPETVIIGGGIGTHFDKFQQPLDNILRHTLTHMASMPTLIQAKHPEEAVPRGCRLYALRHLTR